MNSMGVLSSARQGRKHMSFTVHSVYCLDLARKKIITDPHSKSSSSPNFGQGEEMSLTLMNLSGSPWIRWPVRFLPHTGELLRGQ